MRSGYGRRQEPALAETEVLECIGQPMQLAAGHPLRGNRCLICAAMIGSLPVRTVTLIDARRKNCSCGAVATLTYLVCAGHDLDGEPCWHQLALDRWNGHHKTTMGMPA